MSKHLDDKHILEVLSYICTTGKWKEFFNKTEKQAKKEYGIGIVNVIKNNYPEYKKKMDFGRRHYGGTNMTNYRLRQYSTIQGTPSFYEY